MGLFASFRPSRSDLYQAAGLVVFLGSVALIMLGQAQTAIWLVLSAVLAFVIEGRCRAVEAAEGR